MPKQTVSQITGCQSCPVRNRFPEATFVPCKEGYGKRLVVSDRPAEEDAIKGAPLSGGAGRVFDSLAKKAGIDRAELTIIHTTNCWDAKAGYLDYQAGTAHCFKAHVEPVLRSRDWERIDLLGEEALEALTGEYGISKWRGSPMQVPLLDPEKYLALPTLHPVKLMKEQALWPVVAGDLRKSIQPPPEIYNLYPSVPELQAFRPKRFTFDIETPQYRTLGKDAPVEIVGLCAERYKAMVAPFTSAYKPEIVRLFAEAAEVIGQNLIQFDLPRLAKEGVVISDDCQIWDIMLLHHLRFPNLSGESGREKQEKNNSGGHDLEFIGSQFSSKPCWKHLKGELPLYCARDTDVTHISFEELYKLCQQAGLLDLYKLVQVPLAKICYLMQEQGIQRDPSRLAEVRKQLIAEIAEDELALPEPLRSQQIAKKRRVPAPEGTLSEKTGKPVKYIHVDDFETISPWRSPKFKQDFLYNVCKLEIQRDPKEGTVTVGKWALDRLYRRNKETHPWLLKLKRVCKNGHMLSGFCKEDTQGPITRLHPSFNVHGTSSGRLSSSGDAGNFQNQPPTARALYVPSHPDWEMMEVDYSQIENRLTAYLAKDTLRLQRYIDNPDFSEHKYAASIFFNMDYKDVEKDNDRETPYGKAKPIVHGSNYGMGAKKISEQYDMDLTETKDLLFKWKQEIRKTVEWQKDVAKLAEQQGYLSNPFGRKRWFYTSKLYTESLSFIPQSTAADIIIRAMIALCHERVNWPLEKVKRIVQHIETLPKPANLLLQVHDSCVFEYPISMREQVLGTIKRVFEQPWPELKGFSVPVGISIGPSWGETKPYISPKTL